MPRIKLMDLHFRAVATHRFGTQVRVAHEPGDPTPAHDPAHVSQLAVNPRAPVPLTMVEENARDLEDECPVLLRVRAHAASAIAGNSYRTHRA
jgi:hypothetical protein